MNLMHSTDISDSVQSTEICQTSDGDQIPEIYVRPAELEQSQHSLVSCR